MARSRFVFVALASLLGFVLLSACDLLFPKGSEPTYTVSGTITAPYYSMSGPITVTITNGTSTLSSQVSLSGSFGAESAAYSVAGLPAGTYTVTASFTCSSYSTGVSYSVDGLVQVSPAITVTVVPGGPPHEVTVGIEGLGITASETLDIDLGNLG